MIDKSRCIYACCLLYFNNRGRGLRMKIGFWNKKAESGRTMMELLAVLAIFGVMSIVGISGYRYATQAYRENETLNDISVTVAGTRTWDVLRHYGDRSVDSPFILPIRDVVSNVRYRSETTAADENVEDQALEARELESFTTAVHAPVWARIEHPGAFTIRVSGLSQSMCKKLVMADFGNTYVYKQPEHNDFRRDFDKAEKYLIGSLIKSQEDIDALCKSIDPDDSRIPPVQKQVADAMKKGLKLPSVQTLDANNNTLVLYFGMPDDCALTRNTCGQACYDESDDGTCTLHSPGIYGCPCDSSNPPADKCLYCDNGIVAVKSDQACAGLRDKPCGGSDECISGKPYRKDNNKFSVACCESIGGRAATDAVCCIGTKEWNGNINSLCEISPHHSCFLNNPYDPDLYPEEKVYSADCCAALNARLGTRNGVVACCRLPESTFIVKEHSNHVFSAIKKPFESDDIFGDTTTVCCWPGDEYVNRQCCEQAGGKPHSSLDKDGFSCCDPKGDGTILFSDSEDKACCFSTGSISSFCADGGGASCQLGTPLDVFGSYSKDCCERNVYTDSQRKSYHYTDVNNTVCCNPDYNKRLGRISNTNILLYIYNSNPDPTKDIFGTYRDECCERLDNNRNYISVPENYSINGKVCCQKDTDVDVFGKRWNACCRNAGGWPVFVSSWNNYACCSVQNIGQDIYGFNNDLCTRSSVCQQPPYINVNGKCCHQSYEADFDKDNNGQYEPECCKRNGGIDKKKSVCCDPALNGDIMTNGNGSRGQSEDCCDPNKTYQPTDFCCPYGKDTSKCISPCQGYWDDDQKVCCKDRGSGCECMDYTCQFSTPSKKCCPPGTKLKVNASC